MQARTDRRRRPRRLLQLALALVVALSMGFEAGAQDVTAFTILAKEKAKIKGCGSDRSVSALVTVIDMSELQWAVGLLTEEEDILYYEGLFTQRDRHGRKLDILLNRRSADTYAFMLGSWAADMCGAEEVEINALSILRSRAKMNKKRSKIAVLIKSTAIGSANGQSGKMKHTFKGKGEAIEP